jgi:hypothetical protein
MPSATYCTRTHQTDTNAASATRPGRLAWRAVVLRQPGGEGRPFAGISCVDEIGGRKNENSQIISGCWLPLITGRPAGIQLGTGVSTALPDTPTGPLSTSTVSFEAAAGGFGRSLRQSPVRPALTCDSTALTTLLREATSAGPAACATTTNDPKWLPNAPVSLGRRSSGFYPRRARVSGIHLDCARGDAPSKRRRRA